MTHCFSFFIPLSFSKYSSESLSARSHTSRTHLPAALRFILLPLFNFDTHRKCITLIPDTALIASVDLLNLAGLECNTLIACCRVTPVVPSCYWSFAGSVLLPFLHLLPQLLILYPSDLHANSNCRHLMAAFFCVTGLVT